MTQSAPEALYPESLKDGGTFSTEELEAVDEGENETAGDEE